MSFDKQPDGDPHGECAAEIHRLESLLRQINILACYASEENTDAREAALLEIGKLARSVPKAETPVKHSAEDDFQHFLSYSGLGESYQRLGRDVIDLRVAYYTGAGIDVTEPCSTCGGTGEIDETLGGIHTSNQHAPCPDCTSKAETPDEWEALRGARVAEVNSRDGAMAMTERHIKHVVTNEDLETARLYAGLHPERCPELGRSHDSRPCILCGKTIFNDVLSPARSSNEIK